MTGWESAIGSQLSRKLYDFHWFGKGGVFAALVGTWAENSNTVYQIGTVLTNAGGAGQDNEIAIPFYLDQGAPNTRVLHLLGQKDEAYGISTVSVNDVSQGTIDWYMPSPGDTNVFVTMTVANLRIGVNSLKFKMTSKNVASIGFRLALQCLWFT